MSTQFTLDGTLGVDAENVYGENPNALGEELEVFGITPEAVGKTADSLDSQYLGNIYRYQFMSEYWFGDNKDDDNSPVAPIEFRTIIYTVGQPSQALMDHLREVVNPRQKTVFNTGIYSTPDPGYIEAMEPFVEYNENVEGPDQVGLTDLEDSVIGVPMFETEFYGEDGETRGLSKGYVNPFTIDQDVQDFGLPGQETWNLSFNSSRGDYQVSPPGGPGRARTSALNGKEVYINGKFIGTLAKDGRTWLKKEYARGDGHTYNYRGRTMWSREGLVSETQATYSALRDGGNLYKVNESDDAILLVTAAGKPDDFDPVDASRIEESAVGRTVDYQMRLDDAEPTTFDIRTDRSVRGALGRYSTPAERTISEGSTFLVIDRQGERYQK